MTTATPRDPDAIDPRALEMLHLLKAILARMGLDGLRRHLEAFQADGRADAETAAIMLEMATILDRGRPA